MLILLSGNLDKNMVTRPTRDNPNPSPSPVDDPIFEFGTQGGGGGGGGGVQPFFHYNPYIQECRGVGQCTCVFQAGGPGYVEVDANLTYKCMCIPQGGAIPPGTIPGISNPPAGSLELAIPDGGRERDAISYGNNSQTGHGKMVCKIYFIGSPGKNCSPTDPCPGGGTYKFSTSLYIPDAIRGLREEWLRADTQQKKEQALLNMFTVFSGRLEIDLNRITGIFSNPDTRWCS